LNKNDDDEIKTLNKLISNPLTPANIINKKRRRKVNINNDIEKIEKKDKPKNNYISNNIIIPDDDPDNNENEYGKIL
jgi:hypothetical protein